MIIPNICKNKKCSKPPTSWGKPTTPEQPLQPGTHGVDGLVIDDDHHDDQGHGQQTIHIPTHGWAWPMIFPYLSKQDRHELRYPQCETNSV